MPRTAVAVFACALVWTAGCGSPQTGPAPLERIPALVAQAEARSTHRDSPAPRTARRPDALLAALPADPLAVMGMDLEAFLAGLADGSLVHGHAVPDGDIHRSFRRILEILLDHATASTIGAAPRFDLGALQGVAAGLYELDGVPNVIVALPDGFVGEPDALETLLHGESLLVRSLDGMLLIADAPGFDLLDARPERFVLDAAFDEMVPGDALAFVAVPDAAGLPMALRFAAFAQMGGAFQGAAIAVAGDGRIELTVTGGGADHVHHRIAIIAQRLMQSVDDVPFAPPEVRAWLEAVASAALGRIALGERADGGVVVRVEPPACGGALQNHAPLALLWGALEYGAVAVATERFSPPAAPPLAEACDGAGSSPTVTHELLPMLQRGEQGRQESHVAMDLGALAHEILAAGAGLLPVRLADTAVEPVLRYLDPSAARAGAGPTVELLLSVDGDLQGVSTEAARETEHGDADPVHLIARLPASIADRLPVFVLVMAGFDVVDHPALGTLVVSGLGERLPPGDVAPLDDRMAALVDLLGHNTSVRLVSGPPGAEAGGEQASATGEEVLPRPLHTIALRHSDGYWLQVVDWPEGQGPRAEASTAGSAGWTEMFLEGFTEALREEDEGPLAWDDRTLDALVEALRDWIEAVTADTIVVRERDTTVALYRDHQVALIVKTGLGMGATAMVLSHLLDPGRWGYGMAPPHDGVAPPDGAFEGATDDVF